MEFKERKAEFEHHQERIQKLNQLVVESSSSGEPPVDPFLSDIKFNNTKEPELVAEENTRVE